MRRRHDPRGVTLLEILVALLILSIVVLASGAAVGRAIGFLGVSQSSLRTERPARLRTIAMEYILAETEFLRNKAYDDLRDASTCIVGTLPLVHPYRRILQDGAGLLTGEPSVPPPFYAADIAITNEGNVNINGCYLRRISVYLYLRQSELPDDGSIGTGKGTVFVRGDTARAPR